MLGPGFGPQLGDKVGYVAGGGGMSGEEHKNLMGNLQRINKKLNWRGDAKEKSHLTC